MTNIFPSAHHHLLLLRESTLLAICSFYKWLSSLHSRIYRGIKSIKRPRAKIVKPFTDIKT